MGITRESGGQGRGGGGGRREGGREGGGEGGREGGRGVPSDGLDKVLAVAVGHIHADEWNVKEGADGGDLKEGGREGGREGRGEGGWVGGTACCKVGPERNQ